jgi:F0F1-type ATP synthase membrane subunit b/b'
MSIGLLVFLSMMASYFLGFLTGVIFEKTKSIKKKRKEKDRERQEMEKKLWDSYVINLNDYDL